ncbi:MAG: 4Fe-4S dicluster domain-containing protein [Chloroflexi bacterium]|nr:4Fe-4S dicluster domain-containing protein [Chloroflexota bacterium]
MQIQRRSFIRGVVSLAGASLLSGISGINGSRAEAADRRKLTGWADRSGVLTDLNVCIGCRRCEKACNEENSLPVPDHPFDDLSVLERHRRTNAGAYTVVNRYYLPDWLATPMYRKVQCNHCEEPACASACPVGAIKKSPEGAVIYNEDVCIGCRYCMTACPFYIPAFDWFNARTPAIKKCDMCYSRITRGRLPACVEACPVEALVFGKRKQLIELARDRIADEPHRYSDHIYGEYEAGGTGWLYISGAPFRQLDFPEDLGDKPLPELTKEFLSAVPGVLVIWPALLGGFYMFTRNRNCSQSGPAAGQNGNEVSNASHSK